MFGIEVFKNEFNLPIIILTLFITIFITFILGIVYYFIQSNESKENCDEYKIKIINYNKMFTTFRTDISTGVIEKNLIGNIDKTIPFKPFQIQLSKSEYTLRQVQRYAVKNKYPIIVETKSGKNWYLKGYGYNRKNLQNLINYKIEQKYRQTSTLYFINE